MNGEEERERERESERALDTLSLDTVRPLTLPARCKSFPAELITANLVPPGVEKSPALSL